MDNFFTTFRKLEHELAEPSTQFMQSLLLEFENEIVPGSNEQPDILTREEVNHLILTNVRESLADHKQRQEVFCESQVIKFEEESKKRKRALLNNTEDKPDDGYVAESGLSEISDSENEDSAMDNIEEELYFHEKKKENKRILKKRMQRLGYLAHRIDRDIPELFNGRQFIRQAENIIQSMGGEAVEDMNRVREAYFNPKIVTSDVTIEALVNFAKGENRKDAEDAKAFEDRINGQSQE